MLRASGISYEQRILLERANEQIHLLLGESNNMKLSDRIILKLREDITKNGKLINADQTKLRHILLKQNQDFYNFGNPFNANELSESFVEIDTHWVQFNDRINKISSASLQSLRAGDKYWQPADALLAHGGILFNQMVDLNKLVYQASFKQNVKIRTLYTLIFGCSLAGIWLIWCLVLRPLSKGLIRNCQQLISKNEALEFQTNHDAMTRLFNRLAFNKKMKALDQRGDGIGQSSLILIDIDEFKSINDNLGHQMGDAVLIKIANIIQENQLETESAYRLGGDEFAIIIDEVKSRDQLIERLEKLIGNIRLPTIMDGQKITTSCSLGVAWGDKCGETFKEAFSAADTALYRVKEDGRNHYQLFEDISNQNVTHILGLEKALRKAVAEKQFIVHYQPIIHMETDELDSFEALARWQHPERGELLPEEWMETANRLGLTGDITFQIMDLVEQDYHRWKDKTLAIKTVYINITEQTLINGSAYLKLKGMLTRTQDKSGWLGVEITESNGFERSFEKMQEQLQLIHKAGVQISLDDFGKGCVNLSHMRSIPYDRLKIDKSFTAKILDDQGMYLIVKSLIDLSVGLSKKVICEGVEQPEVQVALKQLGCKYSQGFLHSKSLPFNQSCSLLSPSGGVA